MADGLYAQRPSALEVCRQEVGASFWDAEQWVQPNHNGKAQSVERVEETPEEERRAVDQ